ncbi:MAG: CDP-alcohol phosphatidyltransferase family protein [Methanobacteriota archaeon]|nr:MAG: CDP-alcohol phosphatidyltransferase family protein [Euryarchaeota archaeon]
MTWLRKVSYADLLTIGNGVSGFIAITYIIDGKFLFAYVFLVLAIVLDGLDGVVARRFGTKHSLGRHLDISSDTISFCFAPAILLYSTFYDLSKGSALVSIDNALAVIVPGIVVVAGVIHLARYASRKSPTSHFVGLPTAANTFLIVALCLLIGKSGLIWDSFQYPLLLIATLTSILVVSEIGYVKIEGTLKIWAGVALGLLILVSIIKLTRLEPVIGVVLATAALSLGILYVVAGPFLATRGGDVEGVSAEAIGSERS